MAVLRPALLVALCLAAAPSFAASRSEAIDRSALRVCADPATPPLSSQDGKGYENRIAELFGKELGVPVTYTWFPSGIGFYRRTLNARRCDIVMGTVAGGDNAQTTIPYYRSTYVLVTRAADNITVNKLDDDRLKTLVVGGQSESPAVDALAKAGLLDKLRAYTLNTDGSAEAVGQRMIGDVAAKRIDAAVIWGPIGAYFASLQPGVLRVTALATGPGPSPLAFEISMAVRYGEPQWKARVEKFIRDNRAPVQDILAASHVPLLPLLPEAEQ